MRPTLTSVATLILAAAAAAAAEPASTDRKTDLKITATFNFKKDLIVGAGVFWNKYQVDKREGIIGWCDGDHGESGAIRKGPPDGNSVRYFNTGKEPFHGIAPGEVGYLVPPRHSPGVKYAAPPFAKVSDYDNYHWWYAPSDDKFFWICTTSTDRGGGRYGIFDLQKGDWSHGNKGSNASEWPEGPYWWEYVEPPANGGFTIAKNSPNGFSEALDMAVAISGTRFFIIERNPDYPAKSKAPRRVITPSVADKPYAVKEANHNQFMNSGLCVGEWFYFIRPATEAEKKTYPDPAMREFWKVRLVPPYDQHRKLAHFPKFDSVGTASWGPLLVYDEPSESILAVYDRLWVYDIASDKWTDRTPGNWQRIMYAVGGMKKSTREIIFRPGSAIDQPKGAKIDGHPARHYWSKIKLEGGEKPKAAGR
jgi:hypothetical protein